MKKGFTMVEVLLVIVIIGTLYSVITFNGTFAVDKASETSTLVDIGVYEIAISDVCYNNEITNMSELCGKLNETIEGQFQVYERNGYLESISRTNKNGEKYQIKTNNYTTYVISCGSVSRTIEV